jgi:hypothetical protein
MLQPPQCVALVSVSTHWLPQLVRLPHSHTPAVQVPPFAHVAFSSVRPSQSSSASLHTSVAPARMSLSESSQSVPPQDIGG